jgi:hypothetical protein
MLPDTDVPKGTDEQPPVETDSSPQGEVDNQQSSEETDPNAAGTADATPEGKAEEAAPEAEDTESEESAEQETDLSDDDIAAIIDVYGDRILTSGKLADANAKSIRDEVAKQVATANHTREVEGENAGVVEKGRTAVTAFTQAVENYRAEFKKAGAGESFNAAIADGDELGGLLKDFGSAVLAGTQGTYERAIQAGFNSVLSNDLPELSDKQAEELTGITDTWNRMKNDPQQANVAQAFLVSKLWEFATPLLKAAGAQEERSRAKKGQPLKERIAGTNAIAAAKAAIEKQKVPPKGSADAPRGRPGATIEEYERLVGEGKFDKAQEVVNAMERAASR